MLSRRTRPNLVLLTGCSYRVRRRLIVNQFHLLGWASCSERESIFLIKFCEEGMAAESSRGGSLLLHRTLLFFFFQQMQSLVVSWSASCGPVLFCAWSKGRFFLCIAGLWVTFDINIRVLDLFNVFLFLATGIMGVDSCKHTRQAPTIITNQKGSTER